MLFTLLLKLIIQKFWRNCVCKLCLSRHAVVHLCHVAKKAGAPHHKYIKENVIFIHTYIAPSSLLELESFLYCNCPAPHISNLSKITLCNHEIRAFKFWLTFFSLFRGLGGLDYSFCTLYKNIIKCKCIA